MARFIRTEVKDRDLYYYRRRFRNRIFARLAAFFAEEAEKTGITKKDLADILKKDPAQITRWLSEPSNLTLDTISDLLLALGAEIDQPRVVRFTDRPTPNYQHPLIAVIIGSNQAPNKNASATSDKIIKAQTADSKVTHSVEAVG